MSIPTTIQTKNNGNIRDLTPDESTTIDQINKFFFNTILQDFKDLIDSKQIKLILELEKTKEYTISISLDEIENQIKQINIEIEKGLLDVEELQSFIKV